MENNEQESQNDISIGDVVDAFVHNIISLANTMPLATNAVASALADAMMRQKEFILEVAQNKETREPEHAKLYEFIGKFVVSDKEVRGYKLALKNVPNSLLVALISQYDAFLSKLIKTVFLIQPEMLSSSERSLTLAQLIEFGSLEEARNHILEKEVENVLRKSHAEQFQWMENKFNITLRKDLNVWPRFIELTERRNLFVHTGGVVSSQ